MVLLGRDKGTTVPPFVPLTAVQDFGSHCSPPFFPSNYRRPNWILLGGRITPTPKLRKNTKLPLPAKLGVVFWFVLGLFLFYLIEWHFEERKHHERASWEGCTWYVINWNCTGLGGLTVLAASRQMQRGGRTLGCTHSQPCCPKGPSLWSEWWVGESPACAPHGTSQERWPEEVLPSALPVGFMFNVCFLCCGEWVRRQCFLPDISRGLQSELDQ